MKRVLVTAGIAAVMTFVCSCGNEPFGSTSGSENYFPVSLGDYWEYAYSAYQISPDSLLWSQGTETREIVSIDSNYVEMERTLDLWFNMGQSLIDTLSATDTLLYFVDSDSVVLLNADSTIDSKILDFPLQIDKTWGNFLVLDMDASVETPAKFFDGCAEVQGYSDNYDCNYFDFYFPGVGLVATSLPEVQLTEWTYDVEYKLLESNLLR
jgi:hypothetical protein